MVDEINAKNINPLVLFKNLEYTIIILSSILIFVPSTTVFIYLPNFIKEVGGSPGLLGYILFFNAISEAPIFFYGKEMIKKFKPISLLVISSIFYTLRLIIVFNAVSPSFFIIYGALQSLSFGVLLMTARFYINVIARARLKTTAQSILTMSSFGVGGIVASLSGGYIMDVFGMTVLYRVSMTFSILANLLLVGLLLYKRWK